MFIVPFFRSFYVFLRKIYVNMCKIPSDFILNNSSKQHLESMQDKWEIYNFMKNWNESKIKAYRILALRLNKSTYRIKNIYKSLNYE